MNPSNSILDTFFYELKKYNTSNFKTLINDDLSCVTPKIYKAYSSAVTRYFIFIEKHPDITEVEANMLYYQARIDMVARYFSEYPMSNPDDLKPFQEELRRYVKRYEGKNHESAAAV